MKTHPLKYQYKLAGNRRNVMICLTAESVAKPQLQTVEVFLFPENRIFLLHINKLFTSATFYQIVKQRQNFPVFYFIPNCNFNDILGGNRLRNSVWSNRVRLSEADCFSFDLDYVDLQALKKVIRIMFQCTFNDQIQRVNL